MNSKLLERKTEKPESQMFSCGGGLKADETWMSAVINQGTGARGHRQEGGGT